MCRVTSLSSLRPPFPSTVVAMDLCQSHHAFLAPAQLQGDTWIDDHHTNEDIALALGTALGQALGDRAGIHRFGNFTAPLDEALVRVVLDLSGRPHLTFKVPMPTERVGNYDTQLVSRCSRSRVLLSRVIATHRTDASPGTPRPRVHQHPLRSGRHVPATPLPLTERPPGSCRWSTFSSPWSTPRG